MQGTKTRLRSRLGFYAVFLILAVAVWRIEHYMNAKTFASGWNLSLASETVTDWQKMEAQSVTETTGLLTTLATALLGALGLLLVKTDPRLAAGRDLWSAVLCAACGGISIFFGFVTHLYLIGMFSYNTVDIYRLAPPRQCQFYALLAGAFFLADFAFNGAPQEG